VARRPPAFEKRAHPLELREAGPNVPQSVGCQTLCSGKTSSRIGASLVTTRSSEEAFVVEAARLRILRLQAGPPRFATTDGYSLFRAP
jgi:hypothetical protein